MHSLSLDDLLDCDYVDGGRYAPKLDCWGIVRIVYFRIHGVRLPMLDRLRAHSLREKTLAHRDMIDRLSKTKPTHGAIAAAITGKLCEHVGIVINVCGDLRVLEITPMTGVRALPLKEFEALSHVEYYTYN